MPDYSKSQIYSVRIFENDNIIYIGSTTQSLAVRFGGHKRDSKCSLYQYIQDNYNGDFKCCYIEILEPYECNSKIELNRKEGELIRKYKADKNYFVINKYTAGRTDQEYYQDNVIKILEAKKQYAQDNAETIKTFQKQYRKDNADKIKQGKQQYYQNNAEKIKEYQRQYRKVKKAEKTADNIKP
jgi:hypothetical protein